MLGAWEAHAAGYDLPPKKKTNSGRWKFIKPRFHVERCYEIALPIWTLDGNHHKKRQHEKFEYLTRQRNALYSKQANCNIWKIILMLITQTIAWDDVIVVAGERCWLSNNMSIIHLSRRTSGIDNFNHEIGRDDWRFIISRGVLYASTNKKQFNSSGSWSFC